MQSIIAARCGGAGPVRSRWNVQAAQRYVGDLEACVYVSRLLGAEPSLVLFGGGNTSVKHTDGGETLLYVKGSGADLAQVEARHFTPVSLERVRRLIEADDLTNDALAESVARCVRDGD